jgi:hypothetical protein
MVQMACWALEPVLERTSPTTDAGGLPTTFPEGGSVMPAGPLDFRLSQTILFEA